MPDPSYKPVPETATTTEDEMDVDPMAESSVRALRTQLRPGNAAVTQSLTHRHIPSRKPGRRP